MENMKVTHPEGRERIVQLRERIARNANYVIQGRFDDEARISLLEQNEQHEREIARIEAELRG